MSADYLTAWVCVDCYFAHHYGARQVDGEWFAGESDTPCDREPLALLGDYEIADNTYPNGDNPEDPDETGEREFSWAACEGCGSTLGGSRHRLALFAPRVAS